MQQHYLCLTTENDDNDKLYLLSVSLILAGSAVPFLLTDDKLNGGFVPPGVSPPSELIAVACRTRRLNFQSVCCYETVSNRTTPIVKPILTPRGHFTLVQSHIWDIGLGQKTTSDSHNEQRIYGFVCIPTTKACSCVEW